MISSAAYIENQVLLFVSDLKPIRMNDKKHETKTLEDRETSLEQHKSTNKENVFIYRLEYKEILFTFICA